MKTKTSKQEAEFFRYMTDVQIVEVQREVWERYALTPAQMEERYFKTKGDK